MSARPNRIRELRELRGWSQEEVAARVPGNRKPHFTTIDKLEDGKRALSLPWMERIAVALEVSPLDLLPEQARDRMIGGKRRGGRPAGSTKQAISIRLDVDVVEKFKSTGPGWQSRINDALKRALV